MSIPTLPIRHADSERSDVSPAAPHARQVGFRWHVIHTRSRQEKAVADALEAAGGSPYLPLYRRVMYYGHRHRVVEAPLFSCYLFHWGLPEHAYPAVSNKRVSQILPVPDQVTLETEINQIRLALAAGAVLSPYRYLTRGRRVRVLSGPFEGIEGVIEDDIKQDRLILKVHAIGRALSLEIDASLLEPAD
jgi:transcription antitermination factor NusG